MKTFDDALKYLEHLWQFGIKEGLERTLKLADALNNPQNCYRTVHVTGTNGKGSTCAMLAKILSTAGYRVGLFTSPHLESYTERIRILDGKAFGSDDAHTNCSPAFKAGCERIKVDGENIPENDFAEMIFRVKNCNVPATHFETLTVAAFEYFRVRKVDIAVIEVGLGGTLDSTNIITPAVSVITNVARDHENILGDLDGIARNKSGIIKPNVPVVTGATGRPLEIIRQVAAEKNSPVHTVTKVFDGKINLRGDFQRMNAAIAIETARLLNIADEKIFAGLERVTWAGRFEIFDTAAGTVVIDGAHNPNGATALRQALDENFPNGRRTWVFGVLRDKNFDDMVKILFRRDDFVIVTKPPSERAASTETICAVLREQKISCVAVEDNFEAVEKLLSTDVDVKIIAGSLYLIGNVRRFAIKLSS